MAILKLIKQVPVIKISHKVVIYLLPVLLDLKIMRMLLIQVLLNLERTILFFFQFKAKTILLLRTCLVSQILRIQLLGRILAWQLLTEPEEMRMLVIT